MKKIIALLLAIAITSCLFTACSSSSESTATNRLEEIIERGYLEVVTEPYFVPNEFIDPTIEGDNQVVGMDIEVAQAIADELGVELVVISLEFSALLAAMADGKYDMAISALGYTPARAETMNLSDGYYFGVTSGYSLVIREEDADTFTSDLTTLADASIVSQSGSVQEALLYEQIEEYGELKSVSSTTDGYLMITENKVDVMVVSIANAQIYIDANPDCGLMIMEDFKFEVDDSMLGTRIAMPYGEDELTEFVNEVITGLLESGQTEIWYEEYVEYAKSLGVE